MRATTVSHEDDENSSVDVRVNISFDRNRQMKLRQTHRQTICTAIAGKHRRNPSVQWMPMKGWTDHQAQTLLQTT